MLALLTEPLALPFLLGLYGGGVLLVREAAIRWRRGWPTIFALGAAYGIAEEGLATKTFFDPAHVGILGSFGRVDGVNTVWATELTLFHAVFSIALPILVVRLAFPETSEAPWLLGRRAPAVMVAYGATLASMFFLFDPGYGPASTALLLAGLGIASLVIVARALPREWPSPRRAVRRTRAFALGAAFPIGLFGIAWIGPSLFPLPAAWLLLMVAFAGAMGYSVLGSFASSAEPRARKQLVLGLLTPLLALGVLLSAYGEPPLGVVVAFVIVALYRWRIDPSPVPASGTMPIGPGAAGIAPDGARGEGSRGASGARYGPSAWR